MRLTNSPAISGTMAGAFLGFMLLPTLGLFPPPLQPYIFSAENRRSAAYQHMDMLVQQIDYTVVGAWESKETVWVRGSGTASVLRS